LSTPTFPRRVLVVDDNRDAADSFALILRRMGHYVRVCYEGSGALEAARQQRADVVLLDLVMPGMDGYEVARQLRADSQLRHVLIVATTGFGQEEDRERSREAGIDQHLLKPLDPDFLTSLLGRRR
jgi:two-component system CheB/CheR fusion protein